MHLTNDVIEGLQAVGGFLLAIGIPLLGAGKAIAAAKARAYAKAWLKSQGAAVPDSEPPATPLLTEADLVRSLRAQLMDQERLHSAEVRALRRELSEARKETLEERGRNASLTYATAKLREEYRRSLGLDSDAPPADPRSSGAITVPPKPR